LIGAEIILVAVTLLANVAVTSTAATTFSAVHVCMYITAYM
jgi:hypothetical protein